MKRKTLTKRVREELSPKLIRNLWFWANRALNEIEGPKEGMQLFDLIPIEHSAILENQLIIHTIKEIDYQRNHSLCIEKNIEAKICIECFVNEMRMMFFDELANYPLSMN